MTPESSYLEFLSIIVKWGSFFGLSSALIIWGFTTCEAAYAWNPPDNLKMIRLIILVMLYPFLIFTDAGAIFKEDKN